MLRLRHECETTLEHYRDLFHRAPPAYLIFDGDRIVEANAAAGALLDLEPSELVGRRFSSFVAPSSSYALRGHLRTLLVSEESVGCELGVKTSKGQRKIVRLTSICTRAVSARWRTVMVDVTAERRAELRAMRENGGVPGGPALKSLGHDLAHLFMWIVASADAALSRLGPEAEARGSVGTLKLAALHGNGLVTDLLDGARNSAERSTDLNHVVKSAEPLVRQIMGETTQLEIETAATGATIQIGSTELTQVLLSLASSARMALNGEGGVLRILTRNAGDDETFESATRDSYVVLSVIGNGLDSEPNTLTRSLEPFLSERTAGLGAEIGLPNIYAIVEKAGGHVSVRNGTESATTVHIALPRTASVRTSAP